MVVKFVIVRIFVECLGMVVDNGFYDLLCEYDVCGVGFIVQMDGDKFYKIVVDGFQILENLIYCGVVGVDLLMGDGVGMLVQILYDFLVEEMVLVGMLLLLVGDYGVGFIFMLQDVVLCKICEEIVECVICEEGQELIGWCDVLVDNVLLFKVLDIVVIELVFC